MAEKNENYQIQLCCGNCFHKWYELFPKGFKCEEFGYSNKYILKPDQEFVECPVCGCTDVRKVFPSLND